MTGSVFSSGTNQGSFFSLDYLCFTDDIAADVTGLMLPGVVFGGGVFFSPSELFTGQHILFSSLLQTLAFNRAKIWEAPVGFELWILERKSAASASQDSYYVPFLCCQKVEGLRALSRRNTGIALARATKRFLAFVANLVRVTSIRFLVEQFFRSPGS